MTPAFLTGFGYLFFFPFLLSMLYSLFAFFLVLRFKKAHRAPLWGTKVSATVLRPLTGAHEKSYQTLATLCRQTFLPAEIRYGVDSGSDPAVTVVRQLMKDFSWIPMSLHIGFPQVVAVKSSHREGANPKMVKLALLAKHCRSPFVVAIDQDIVVPPTHLEEVISSFSDSRTGMVTSLYRLANPETLGSVLELLMVHANFFPAVLVAEKLEGGLRFAFGATMAFRRDVLERIGGFEEISDYLADDHELGSRIYKAGYRVALSGSIVEHDPGKLSLKDYWMRGIRAARTHRISRPGGYALSLLIQGVPWIAGMLFAFGWKRTILEFILAWGAIQIFLFLASHKVLTDGKGKWWPFIFLPIHEFMRFVFWILAFTGNRVVWRERQYCVLKDGKMALKT